MSILTRTFIRHGKSENPPKRHKLRAGPLSLDYQGGDLRYVRLGDREIIRRLYVAVRDQYWGTVPGIIHDEQIDTCSDAFTIRFTSEHRQGEIHFVWQAQIEGRADGSIRFTMAGQALSAFLKNRIGFCVLHPLRECMGTEATIHHVDGTASQARFPELIAPQHVIDGIIQPVYPFADMRSLRYLVMSGVEAEISFRGDTFEMEDQRNWIDASYKTYGTPLRLLWPVQVQAGDRVDQQIGLTLIGTPASITEKHPEGTTVTLSDQTAALPAIGLCAAKHDEMPDSQAVSRLRALNLSHLRVDLNLSEDYAETLARAQHEASLLGVKLELALTISDNAEVELSKLAKRLAELPLMNVLIFHHKDLSTSARWLTMARRIFEQHQSVPIYGGTNAYFTHINAQLPPMDALDGMVYSVNPQVHASDDLSIMETCEAITATIQTAQSLTVGKSLALSTLTLKPRFNPYNTSNREPEPGQLPSQVDTRQLSLLGAAWTLGSLKAVAESSALQYLTCYATTGWQGIIERASGSPLPERFPSIPGSVFPLYHVLADIAEYSGAEVVKSHSSTPQQVSTLVLRKGNQHRLLVANLSDKPQPMQFEASAGNYRLLDEHCAIQAMTESETWRSQRQLWQGSCTLPPYAYLCLDYQNLVS